MALNQKHKRIIGALFIIAGLLHILFYSFVICISYYFDIPNYQSFFHMGFYKIFWGILTILASLPCIFVGTGLLLNKTWALKGAQVLAFIYLFFVPVGTALGIYVFSVLRRKEMTEMAQDTVALIDDVVKAMISKH